MSNDKIAVSRPLVGILALACLTAAATIWLARGDNGDFAMWQAAFTRVGLILSAFWIALPSRDRDAAWADVSPWTFVGLILAVVAVALRPKLVIPLLIVVGLLSLILRPRAKRRPKRNR